MFGVGIAILVSFGERKKKDKMVPHRTESLFVRPPCTAVENLKTVFCTVVHYLYTLSRVFC